ncbi:MAG: hypothetical protein OEZ36_11090, partial [Spirochaetota bacterium]|nr:hypothetical protein [Spirochaetota bacterium]
MLCTFAISQPVLDLLGRYGEFFIARQSQTSEIILFILILLIPVPVIIIIAELLVLLVNKRYHTGFHLMMVFVLSFLIVMPVAKISGLDGILLIIIALIFSGAFTYGYHKVKVIKSVITTLSPVILI